jgi:hypothetical protein
MKHTELHEELSKIFTELRTKKIEVKQAKELFNGASKILSNCKNELQAIQMGFKVDVPLLGIKKGTIKK